MKTTKKLPITLTKDGFPTSRGEHLVPNPDGEGFLGVKTKRAYQQGYIVFVGRPVSIEQILEKTGEILSEGQIENFFEQIAEFKIGNVIENLFFENESTLVKISERPKSKTTKTIPCKVNRVAGS